jgi:hypothetical protein
VTSLLWLIPALPFASALMLALVRLALVAKSGDGAGSGIDRTLGADRDSGGGGLPDRASIRRLIHSGSLDVDQT